MFDFLQKQMYILEIITVMSTSQKLLDVALPIDDNTLLIFSSSMLVSIVRASCRLFHLVGPGVFNWCPSMSWQISAALGLEDAVHSPLALPRDL